MSICNDKKCNIPDSCTKIQKTIILCNSPYCNYATHIYCAGLTSIKNTKDIDETYFVCNKCKDFLSYSSQFAQTNMEEKLASINDNISVIENKMCELERLLTSTVVDLNQKMSNLENEVNKKHLAFSGKLDSCSKSLLDKNSSLEKKTVTLEQKITDNFNKITELQQKITQITTENKPLSANNTISQQNSTATYKNTKVDNELKYKLRFSGIRECTTTKFHSERKNNDLNKIVEILNFMGINNNGIRDIQRLGKFNSAHKSPRKILVTFTTVWQAYQVMREAYKLKEYTFKVFVAPALSREDAENENKLLKRRRELIEEGVDAKLLKVKNLKLYQEDKEVEVLSD